MINKGAVGERKVEQQKVPEDGQGAGEVGIAPRVGADHAADFFGRLESLGFSANDSDNGCVTGIHFARKG